jgi:hypothetical protein
MTATVQCTICCGSIHRAETRILCLPGTDPREERDLDIRSFLRWATGNTFDPFEPLLRQ